jgi:dihydrofolate reductase
VRRVIVQEFVTLDGFAAGPNGELDFIGESTSVDAVDSEAARDQLDFVSRVDTILLGADTYRMFAQYWPEQTTETELIADALNSTPKAVFSSTLERAPWGSWDDARIVSGSASEEVRRLKEVDGGDMVVWGSFRLVRTLLEEGLVDEFHLWMCPIVLGSGIRLFPEGAEAMPMELLETKTRNGVLSVVVRPV